MKKRSVYIIVSIVLSSLLMTYVDAFVKPEYVLKSLIKIVLFLIVPLLYFVFNKKETISFKKLFKAEKPTMIKAVALGISIYIVIFIGYFLTKGFIDYSGVTEGLTKNHGVNGGNFIYVSLYISLINSFLEEFFFRGFGFIMLKRHVGRRFSYIFSSALFAVYHTGMLVIMFDLIILPLLFTGLFIGGCIFNYLNEKSESIYTSWATHMFANFSINTIGFMLFGIF